MSTSIIGVVGPMASGKGEVVRLLSSVGYEAYSLSGILRKACDSLQLNPTRKALQDIGDLLRTHEGPGALAQRVIRQIGEKSGRRIVIDSIRNPGEIAVLRSAYGIMLIGVDATEEKRFELMQIRGREGDPTTWEEFIELNRRDRGVGQGETGQQVDACLALADTTIQNNETLEEFHTMIHETFVSYGIEGNRKAIEKK